VNRHQRRAQKARSTFQSCKPDDLAKAAVAADQAGQPGIAELMRQVRRGGLAIVFVSDRDDPVTVDDLNEAERPTVVVVGDDDYRATGPSGWRATPTLVAWAAAVVVHAAGATADSYAEAAKAARELGRAVLIETDSAHAERWAIVFRACPVLLVLTRDGAHPVMPPRSAVH
jgi:hypothetical protein